MLFCKTLVVVERQPFQPYSQRRASRQNGERFIKSWVSFACWKWFTQSFPEDIADHQQASDNRESPKNGLDKKVGNAGLAYPQPPYPQRWQLFVSCNAWPATSSQKSISECHKTTLRPGELSQKYPATPDGTNLSEFINLGAWDTYLRRMAMEGEWGD